jgi:hypothetical protein
MRNRDRLRKLVRDICPRIRIRAARVSSRKTKSRQPFIAERKALYATEDRDRDRPAYANQPAPRSCIRNQSLKISPKSKLLPERKNIVLALPSYNRQRLSVIGRGWCPSRSLKEMSLWTERVIRTDAGEAHRLSLSARVLSAQDSQVKAKTTAAEALPTRFEMTPKQLTKQGETAALKHRVRRLPLVEPPPSADATTLPTVRGSLPDATNMGSRGGFGHRITESVAELILPGYYYLDSRDPSLSLRG